MSEEKLRNLKDWREYYLERYVKTGKKEYKDKFLKYAERILEEKDLELMKEDNYFEKYPKEKKEILKLLKKRS